MFASLGSDPLRIVKLLPQKQTLLSFACCLTITASNVFYKSVLQTCTTSLHWIQFSRLFKSVSVNQKHAQQRSGEDFLCIFSKHFNVPQRSREPGQCSMYKASLCKDEHLTTPCSQPCGFWSSFGRSKYSFVRKYPDLFFN